MHQNTKSIQIKTGASQTVREEFANSLSHGIGLTAAIAAFPFLIVTVSKRGDTSGVVAACIFGASMVLLYLSSTLYHAWPVNKTKKMLRVLDHCAIYLLIAGTYTPFTLGVLRGTWGWILFALVWAMAAAGIVIKISGGIRFKKASVILYLLMGWLVVIAIVPLWNNMPAWGLFWLVCGGLAYTGGVKFYMNERDRYAHLVWHLFVMTGTACHFVAVIFFSGLPV